jgi:short-subunit dehydrogenase
MTNFKSAVIVGASSGLGAAFAKALAGQKTRLLIVARREDKLKVLAQELKTLGSPDVQVMVADIAAVDFCDRFQSALKIFGVVDLFLSCAGLMGFESKHKSEHQLAQKLLSTNLTGTVATAEIVKEQMMRQGHGTLALVSSLAGLRAIPHASLYCASKAAIISYCNGLRGLCGSHGLRIFCLIPGFVNTDMVKANRFPMPFIKEPEWVAQLFLHKLQCKRPQNLIAPLSAQLLAWALRLVPAKILSKIVSRYESILA